MGYGCSRRGAGVADVVWLRLHNWGQHRGQYTRRWYPGCIAATAADLRRIQWQLQLRPMPHWASNVMLLQQQLLLLLLLLSHLTWLLLWLFVQLLMLLELLPHLLLLPRHPPTLLLPGGPLS